MKDKNGIEICCENCDDFIPVGTNGRGCTIYEEDCESVFGGERCVFKASSKAYEARIAELQEHNDILQNRVAELLMELLDRTMKENKDVLERLKNWEEYLDKDMPTQSTDADNVSKNGEKSTESGEK